MSENGNKIVKMLPPEPTSPATPNDKLNQAITDLKTEAKEGHERNINDMTQVDEHKSNGENKDALIINDSACYESNEHEVEISD